MSKGTDHEPLIDLPSEPSSLPELPLTDWEATKTTLHLWAQIVGKFRLASSPPRNHWWHAPFYVDVRGLTTRRLHNSGGVPFQIDFDFVDHTLVIKTSCRDVRSFQLNRGGGRRARPFVLAGEECLRVDAADRVLEGVTRVEAALAPGPDLDAG